jgi:ferrous iron transport protein B
LNGQIHIIGVLVAAAIVAGTLYMLFRPYREATKLTTMN